MIVLVFTNGMNIEGRQAPGGDKCKVVKMLNECFVVRCDMFSVIGSVLVSDSFPPFSPVGSRALPAVRPAQFKCKQSERRSYAASKCDCVKNEKGSK